MRARILLAAVTAAAAGLAIVLVQTERPAADAGRHVQSRITVLSRYGTEAEPIWLYITSDRDLRICPDGSGRISERLVERAFPTADEEAGWRSIGEPGFLGVNQTFSEGELTYITSNEVHQGIATVARDFRSSGDGLRRLATLLAETVPIDAEGNAALSKAQEFEGVDISTHDGQVSVSGVSENGARKVSLVFQTSPARLVSETWHALSGRDGLKLPPPFLVFRRQIGLSQTSSCI